MKGLLAERFTQTTGGLHVLRKALHMQIETLHVVYSRIRAKHHSQAWPHDTSRLPRTPAARTW